MLFDHRTSRRKFLQHTGLGLLATGLPGILSGCDKQSMQLLESASKESASKPGFDREFARLLLEVCRYTYGATFPNNVKESEDADKASDRINEIAGPATIARLNDGKSINSTSVACVVSYPDKNIVSYMGTKTEFSSSTDTKQSILDWARNVQFIPVNFSMTKKQLGLGDSNEEIRLEGRVHNGFLKELRAIQEKVIAELEKNGGKNRPLYITGHSQGGAEAALATSAFLKGGFDVKATYTFAAPRSGNKAVADSISSIPIYRIEFGNDIVPHVPTTYLPHQILKFVRSEQEKVKPMIDGLTRLGLKIKPLDPNPKLLDQFDAEHHFVGAGRLCYGNNETKTLHVDISDEEEGTLLNDRLNRLIDLMEQDNLKDCVEHHHLAGTTDETKVGKEGNYTALVSNFALGIGKINRLFHEF